MSCHEPAGPSSPAGTTECRIALIGGPNTGKTTIFNALTGLSARTGNYPGVTVGRAEGTCVLDADHRLELEDLPGVYSLTPVSLDEQISVDVLTGEVDGVQRPEAVLVVADVTTLSRSLVLVADVLSTGLPAIVCLTMADELAGRGGSIDVARLETALGVPVVVANGRRRAGVDDLRRQLGRWREWPTPVIAPPTDPAERMAWIDSILRTAHYRPAAQDRTTARIDRVLLHPLWGTLVFFAVMFGFFQVVFAVASPLQDLVERAFNALGSGLTDAFGTGLVGRFFSEALVGGVGGVLVFVPQIALLFVLITVLEQVGYLTRAAFVMDRVMSAVGLEGRAFVAMLSSFACAIPGIMATRTMPSARERFATMLSVPLITCSARLPVYTMLVAMLVPGDARVLGFSTRGAVMFGLYLLGAVSAMLAARVITWLGGRRASVLPFSMELPPYRWPTWRVALIAVWTPVRGFLRKAGTIILGATVVLWLLLNLPEPMEHSWGADLGHLVAPVFNPLGFDWQINVAVLSSLAARETFVATLGQLNAATGMAVTMAAPTAVALLVFFVYALQCSSTLAVLRRETGRWRWPLLVFVGYGALAWVAAFTAHAVAAMLT